MLFLISVFSLWFVVMGLAFAPGLVHGRRHHKVSTNPPPGIGGRMFEFSNLKFATR